VRATGLRRRRRGAPLRLADGTSGGGAVGPPAIGRKREISDQRRLQIVHWAGAETSDYWNGYMDGAVRSGERAAREVLAHL
jgi:monoamine oxidase